MLCAGKHFFSKLMFDVQVLALPDPQLLPWHFKYEEVLFIALLIFSIDATLSQSEIRQKLYAAAE